jgi:cytosine/adenosine deaminase-related metal-dependent hydrolase
MEGCEPDVILIDLTKPNLTPARKDTVVETIFWAGDGSEVDTVVAGGVVVMQQKKHLTLDADMLMDKIATMADMFEVHAKNAKKITGTGANI